MEASLHLTEIVNVLTAISCQDSKLKKKNIIIANKRDQLLISIIKYNLGDPYPGFRPELIRKPCFHIAEPPNLAEWNELLKYFREHRDVEDKLVAAQRFIQLKATCDRESWKIIIGKEIYLGNEQYLTTVINKEEKSA